MKVTNIFGDLANDFSIKTLLNKFGRFSFTSTSELRVSGPMTVSSGTITTVGTVNNAAVAYGATGANSTAMTNSALTFGSTIRRNFV